MHGDNVHSPSIVWDGRSMTTRTSDAGFTFVVPRFLIQQKTSVNQTPNRILYFTLEWMDIHNSLQSSSSNTTISQPILKLYAPKCQIILINLSIALQSSSLTCLKEDEDGIYIVTFWKRLSIVSIYSQSIVMSTPWWQTCMYRKLLMEWSHFPSWT